MQLFDPTCLIGWCSAIKFAGSSNHILGILQNFHSKIDVFHLFCPREVLSSYTATNQSDLIAVFIGDANDWPETALPGSVAAAATAEASASSLSADRICTSPTLGQLII